jgi:hypothetical protein
MSWAPFQHVVSARLRARISVPTPVEFVSGQSQPVRIERTFSIRRPDRMALTSVGDQTDLRGWYYDGTVTLVSPTAEVWPWTLFADAVG